MRQGEACRLARGDIDLNAETVTIADSKFGKSRMVFLHPTAAAALRAYDRARDEAFPGPAADTFLVNSRGGPLDSHNTSKTFAVLVATAGIKAPPGQRAPRLHDLRHVFTVSTQMGRIASDASFRSLRERALPAAQRAALPGTERPGARDGAGDLRLHGQPGSDATMMQQVPLRCVRHRCA